MKIHTWLSTTTSKLSSVSPSPRLDAELILLHQLGSSDRTWLVSHRDDEISDANLHQLARLVQKRMQHIPLAYILGKREFYGREFIVTPDVLTPRPETENTIDILKKVWYNRNIDPFSSQTATPPLVTTNPPQQSTPNLKITLKSPTPVNPTPPPLSILDVGTGSGCIAVTAQLEFPSATVTALDISERALRIARLNAKNHHVKVHFLQSDLLENFHAPLPQVIIANLPYVNPAWSWLSPELQYEPSEALFANNSGLHLIFKLINQISARLHPSPTRHSSQNLSQKSPPPNLKPSSGLHLLLEADPSQHSDIISYAKDHGFRHLATEDFIIHLYHS